MAQTNNHVSRSLQREDEFFYCLSEIIFLNASAVPRISISDEHFSPCSGCYPPLIEILRTIHGNFHPLSGDFIKFEAIFLCVMANAG